MVHREVGREEALALVHALECDIASKHEISQIDKDAGTFADELRDMEASNEISSELYRDGLNLVTAAVGWSASKLESEGGKTRLASLSDSLHDSDIDSLFQSFLSPYFGRFDPKTNETEYGYVQMRKDRDVYYVTVTRTLHDSGETAYDLSANLIGSVEKTEENSPLENQDAESEGFNIITFTVGAAALGVVKTLETAKAATGLVGLRGRSGS